MEIYLLMSLLRKPRGFSGSSLGWGQGGYGGLAGPRVGRRGFFLWGRE